MKTTYHRQVYPKLEIIGRKERFVFLFSIQIVKH